jgi:hypothetical protein
MLGRRTGHEISLVSRPTSTTIAYKAICSSIVAAQFTFPGALPPHDYLICRG